MSIGAHGDIWVDGVLTSLSVSLADQVPSFIGRKVCPIALMPRETGAYPFFGREKFKVDGADDDLIGDLGEAKTYEVSMSHDHYTCLAHAEKAGISRSEQARSQEQFEVSITPRLRDIIERQLMRHEIKVSTLLQTPGSFHGSNQVDIDNSVNRRWDESAPTPLVDIETAITRIELCINRPPTHMIIPRDVWNVFHNLSAVQLAIKGYTGGALTRQDVANYFGLQEVLIGGGVYDSAKKGQTETRTRIWSGKHVTLLYVTPNPEPRTPNTCYTFTWNPPEGGEDGRIVTRWFDPKLGTMGADFARAAWYHDVKAVGVDSPSGGLIISGYLIRNLIA